MLRLGYGNRLLLRRIFIANLLPCVELYVTASRDLLSNPETLDNGHQSKLLPKTCRGSLRSD